MHTQTHMYLQSFGGAMTNAFVWGAGMTIAFTAVGMVLGFR